MQRVYAYLDEAGLLLLAGQFAMAMESGLVVFLEGNLGAGKTTFTRGVLHALGHKGNVKSPTYTLVEPYPSTRIPVYHFDLYRLKDPEELEYMGIRDYFTENALCLVEWPDCGAGHLPMPAMKVSIKQEDIDHRQVSIESFCPEGDILLRKLA